MKKRAIALLLCVLMAMLLTGCRGYTDASVDPPAGWAEYNVGPLTFRFEAGWSTFDEDELASAIESGTGIFATQQTAQVVAAYISPTREQGTTDLLSITCYTMDGEVTAESLEEIMDDLNSMARTIKNQAGLYTDVVQNARIRHYGKTDALTIAYQLNNDETACLIQTALVPKENFIFQISYCDFTKIQDDSTLESILTSLSINLD